VTGNLGEIIPDVVYTGKAILPAEHMQAFDLLPKTVRRALADALFDYNACSVLREMCRGMTAEKAVESVHMSDRSILRKAYADRGVI
jgi:hypothetical protein